ncbi:hypothetical protein HDU67_007526 [Dinochytrium kinnereticum]|nr:hypothetical protein HDU67_007526 [Dinochytrium kinnereticum]
MDNNGHWGILRGPSLLDGKFRKKGNDRGIWHTWKRQSSFFKLAALIIAVCLTLAFFASKQDNAQSDGTLFSKIPSKRKGTKDSCRNMDVAMPRIPQSTDDGRLALVTGGAGFIGSNLVDRLLTLGYRVRILDNLSTGSIRNIPIDDEKVEFIFGDATNLNVVESAVKGVDTIFHLSIQRDRAASSPQKIRNLIESNTLGIWNVLEAASAHNVSKVVYTSSFLSHGDVLNKTNESGARIVSEFGGEYFVKSLHTLFKIPTVIAKLPSAYGPRQEDRGVLRLDKDPGEFQNDDINASYDFIHVYDIVEGLILAAQEPAAAGESIELGSGIAVKIKDLKDKFSLTSSSFGRSDEGGFVADTCKMKKILGCKSQRQIEEEMPRLLKAASKGDVFAQPWYDDRMMRSTPWLLPLGMKHALPWIGLTGKLDELLDRINPEDKTISLVLWNDEPRFLVLNHIYSLVAKGKAASYIIGASGENLKECLRLNFPCWDISNEKGDLNKPRLLAHLALIFLKKGYNVHLGEMNSVYQGTIKTAYGKFENADVVLKQNLDSPFQIHNENAFIKSNHRSIHMFDTLSTNAKDEGFFESLNSIQDTWANCFDPQQCSEINSKDSRASLALFLNPMQCTPSLFHPDQEEDRYFLTSACFEQDGDHKVTFGSQKGWLIRECSGDADACSLHQYVPIEWLQSPSFIRQFGPHGDPPAFIMNWTPSYLADVSVQKLLEAPWLAPRRQKIFEWQGHHNSFDQMLEIQAVQKRISLIYFNKGFWKVASNCLHSMVKYGKAPNHIIAALDSPTLDHCLEKNLPCVNGSSLTIKNMDSGYSWNEMHWLKPAMANYAVNLGYVVHAGDADISYIRDIWSSYMSLQERTGADLIATDDKPYSPLNTGNVLLMPTFRTRALYSHYVTLGTQRPTANDQYLFHEFQHKNFKICKTKAECDSIHEKHGKEIMAAIFILPTPHSGCYWDDVKSPEGIDDYVCNTHAQHFMYEHGACKGGEKFEWLRDYKAYFLLECGDKQDCPYIPAAWMGQKHPMIPCGPEITWSIFPSDNPAFGKKENDQEDDMEMNRPSEKKETETKDSEKKDTEKKDSEKKDSEKKDSEKKDSEKKESEKKGSENKESEKAEDKKETDKSSDKKESEQKSEKKESESEKKEMGDHKAEKKEKDDDA